MAKEGLWGKRLVVFYRKVTDGFDRILGCEGICIPDQRLSIENMILKGKDVASKRFVKPDAIRVEIWDGFNSWEERPITKYIELNS